MPPMNAVVTALNVYPVKSCGGIALDEAVVLDAGLAHDRQWLVVTPDGRFVTQREQPRLALVGTALEAGRLVLRLPDGSRVAVAAGAGARRLDVVIWDDRCSGLDCGDEVAALLRGDDLDEYREAQRRQQKAAEAKHKRAGAEAEAPLQPAPSQKKPDVGLSGA